MMNYYPDTVTKVQHCASNDRNGHENSQERWTTSLSLCYYEVYSQVERGLMRVTLCRVAFAQESSDASVRQTCRAS